MSKTLVILGRQPALGLAELESLLGAETIQPLSTPGTALLDTRVEAELFKRLGGTIKAAKLLHEFETPQWKVIERYLLDNLPGHLKYTDEGSKLTIGLSIFGLDISTKQLLATGLSIKKVLKSHEKSVRLVPNKEPALNSAQVIHNKLIGANGWELVFIRHGQKVLMGLTVQEQDIEAYTARDQARPKRDSQVGMLPPKLAQIIINLANPPEKATVLDPFCGTGVIMQEARLMGFDVLGTDLEPRMVEYSQANMEWLDTQFQPLGQYSLKEADATSAQWPSSISAIAAETYLGRPFATQPDPETLSKVMKDTAFVIQKFLANVAGQTEPGFRMTIAVPAWHTRTGLKHLKTLDSLEELGYTRLKYVHAGGDDLIYHREGQIVGRQIVTLIRK